MLEDNELLFNRIEKIIQEFSKRKVLIALAESCTGGYVSHMITNISGASEVFERGVVSYSNQAKIDLLGVDPADLDEFGAVSVQVAEQMAEGIRKTSNVNIGIGITGIAGPTGDTPEKPLGLVFIGFSTSKGIFVNKHIIKEDRLTFKKKVLEEILILLELFSY